ncbi:hypothetical protein HDU84_007483 [Entophlyctis sp. JEL0112]|nr:hypothetical protein HDU84_007483 [Entophlyctis sp. JEL0112]
MPQSPLPPLPPLSLTQDSANEPQLAHEIARPLPQIAPGKPANSSLQPAAVDSERAPSPRISRISSTFPSRLKWNDARHIQFIDTATDYSPFVATPSSALPPSMFRPPATTPVSPIIPESCEDSEPKSSRFEVLFGRVSAFLFATYEQKRRDSTKIRPSDDSKAGENFNWRNLEDPMSDNATGRMLNDTEFDTFAEYVTPYLSFKSNELEEEYVSKVILPHLVLTVRFGSLAIGIYTLVQMCFWTNEIQSGLTFIILGMALCLSFVSFFLSTWKKAKFFVQIYSGSHNGYITLTLVELVMICSCLTFDFLRYPDSPGSLVGSAANVTIIYLFLTSGFSGLFINRIAAAFATLIVVSYKSALIYNQATDSTQALASVFIYLLPILASYLLCMESAYYGDKDRRMKLLNTKIINARLKELQEGSKKTEYLLSLTLPPMIVSKLKDVGTGNFDLIAERFDMTSVMFTDIKNFKEIAHSISTESGVSLLNTIFHHMDEVRTRFRNLERIKTINSKMLLVGGLDKVDRVNHLVELIDYALVLRNLFKDEVLYPVSGGKDGALNLKLQIAMGIHNGPLVAGIVGKKTFCYEVYGDVVNTASRMLSIASGGQIVVTSQVWDAISSEYRGVLIGERAVKGKGNMCVYSIESSKISEDLNRMQFANTPVSSPSICGFPALSGSFESVGRDGQFPVDDGMDASEAYRRRLSRAAQKSVRPSFQMSRGSRNINKKIISDVVTAATSGDKQQLPNLSELDFSSAADVRPADVSDIQRISLVLPQPRTASIGVTPSYIAFDQLSKKSSVLDVMPVNNELPETGTYRGIAVDVRETSSGPPLNDTNIPPERNNISGMAANDCLSSPTTNTQAERRRNSQAERRRSSFFNRGGTSFRNSVIINLEEENDPKNPDHRKSIASARQSRRTSLALLGVQSNVQRRWSTLIFAKDMNLSITSRSNLNLTTSDIVSHKSQEIVKRIESIPNLQINSRPSADIHWENEDCPLSFAEINEHGNLEENASAKQLLESLSTPTVDNVEDVHEIRGQVSEVSHTSKAKFVLLQTALAYVGGYKERLTDTEKAVLEHTGTLNFLMDDLCMDLVTHSLTPFLKFSSAELERRYVLETNDKMGQKFWNFSVKGMTCEAVILVVVMTSLYLVQNSDLESTNAAVPLIITVFLTMGSQLLITGVTTVPTKSILGPSTMLILAIWSVITFTIIVIIAGLNFMGLTRYPLLLTVVFAQLPMTHTFLLDGITFSSKLIIAFGVSMFFFVYNFSLHLSFGPLLLMVPYVAIFHMKETTMKSEYLMQLIATTQANLVKEENEKSKKVLTTILPKRIIIKLIEDNDAMFFEEFSMVTVLHMDIAGFTAMSAQLEPLDIVKIFNNLFTYFDSLIEEFRLEKITTIGDAYVASSNLSANGQDPRSSAISVCIVALKMQHFVVNHMNESFVMKQKHRQTLSMRIGINSGPCYGAIMGGDKNFRYDLMGDTVAVAEKVQEHCELAQVFISDTTHKMVDNYHAFKTDLTDIQVGGQKVYHLQMQQFL